MASNIFHFLQCTACVYTLKEIFLFSYDPIHTLNSMGATKIVYSKERKTERTTKWESSVYPNLKLVYVY